MEALRFEKRPDGVAVVLFDSPGTRVNVISKEFFGEFRECLERAEKDPQVRACVLASAKADNFIAGANLKQILAMDDPKEAEAFSREGNRLLDRMAASPKPFVAAIHGPALGGGLEVALACRYRLATDDPKTVLGLPEVMLGLLPGGGGMRRTPPLVGLPKALAMMLTGQRIRARRAYRDGLVDALTSPGGLVETAVKAALALASGTLKIRREPRLFDRLLALPPFRGLLLQKARGDVLKKTRGLYPAPLAILACLESPSKESEEFGRLVASPEAKNLIRLFEATADLKKLPPAPEPRSVRKVGVLGAGLMGEGIASVSLPLAAVVLKDVAEASLSRAAKGIHRGLARRVRSGALPRVERDRQWYRLHPTSEAAALRGSDLVVEAVFEDLDLKRRVLLETEAVISDDAVFASNTSALPISAIARDARRPERVLGMHYFSPVPKMPLLEVIVAPKTAEQAVATAVAFGIAQGKTVIVVKDGPGFYTSRILAPFLNEAILLLDEGADVVALDRALKDFGFPVGPVTLLDEVGIDVAVHVSEDLGKAFASRGQRPSPSLARLHAAGYAGRKNGKGFYLYPKDGARRGLKEVDRDVYAFFGGPQRRSLDPKAMADRLSLLMVNEAIHCLGEGVIASARDGDAGAVLGLGFPPFRGGPFRHVDALGPKAVAARMEQLAQLHGPRFFPAPLLSAMAREGKRFFEA